MPRRRGCNLGDHIPTLPANRPITASEAAVVGWLLDNASIEGSLSHLIESVARLRVVGLCGCGCASVDFEPAGQSGTARPIADAVAKDDQGRRCGVILWGLDGAISGLEVYEGEPGSAKALPSIDSLRPSGAA